VKNDGHRTLDVFEDEEEESLALDAFVLDFVGDVGLREEVDGSSVLAEHKSLTAFSL